MDEDEEKVTHVAMKEVGYTTGNRVTVNVAGITDSDAERRHAQQAVQGERGCR